MDNDLTPDEMDPPIEDTNSTSHYVLNGTRVSIEVPVLVLDGLGAVVGRESIFVQPGGRPRIPQNWSVEPRFLSENPQVIVRTITE